MARYYFPIISPDENVADREGDEFDSADDAHANALGAVRELLAARVKQGEMIADELMEVRSEAGDLLSSISFHAVIKGLLKA